LCETPAGQQYATAEADCQAPKEAMTGVFVVKSIGLKRRIFCLLFGQEKQGELTISTGYTIM
jgi:hypothetical protein